ncbi:MAG: TIR domain-containing protein [Oscillospiraceae bacterium]|nr:TIR domain-containing protein [Oscillospiraceae bacterium]
MEHLVFISHSSKDAPLAQLICHRLEENGVRCWIAPRDIQHEDWAGSIMDGLARSDVCVIIVGEHAADSPEVLKEITEATRSCQYIIPFKVDSIELSPKMRYHLGPCHWLDASTPPIEQRVSELLHRIDHLSEEDVVYQNTRKLNLREHMVWPRPNFLGRERELEQIEELLNEEGTLFLRGMGGIGKSEIAKSYAASHHDQYDTVLFLGYEGSILDLVSGDAVLIENLPPRDPDSETEEQYFDRKMTTLRRIVSERTLLILDNFDVDDDPHFAELANSDAHLLVTTRNEHEDYPTLNIGPIDNFETVRTLFVSSWGKTPKPEDLPVIDEIIRMVGSHTFTVELIARQMKASRRSPEQMLTLLRSGGLHTNLREKIKREGSTSSGSAFEYISKLFAFSNLSEESEQILRWMAMVPYTGIDISLFSDICQLESYDEVNDLIAHSWLQLDEDTDVLSMHPVIADVVREQLHPTVETGKTYIAGLWREVGSLWMYNLEDRARLWPYYANLINNYFEPIPELWTEFSYLENNAWICARYALAIETGHRFLEYTKENFPEDNHKIGIAANYLGGCYHNGGDDLHAAPYYEEGLECQKKAISEQSTVRQWDELSSAYQKVGRCAYMIADYEKAKACFEESIRISSERCNKEGYYVNAFLEMGCMYLKMEDYENALRYVEKSQELYVAKSGADNPNSGSALTNIGKCKMHLGDFAGARQALEEALRLNIRFNGIASRQTLWGKEALADLSAAEGNKEEALRVYEELEAEMEQAFGEQSQDLIALREKVHAMENA